MNILKNIINCFYIYIRKILPSKILFSIINYSKITQKYKKKWFYVLPMPHAGGRERKQSVGWYMLLKSYLSKIESGESFISINFKRYFFLSFLNRKIIICNFIHFYLIFNVDKITAFFQKRFKEIMFWYLILEVIVCSKEIN